ncbi:hypothetical protein FHT09_003305 [Xanthomonas arboricola]|uniref:hypothetical protein n=1 Tax=Xanthomonas TaxID=338 RepID=UPI000CEE0DC4|nr:MULTISPECIES: hypothetical protein [Xanthomonas]MBB5737520.1 hypothetical protein [Xanthomonas sp. CFBP 8152]PPT73447.1 hypothetical protein XarbCFBP8152_20535 [Xanthomonas arboricola]
MKLSFLLFFLFVPSVAFADTTQRGTISRFVVELTYLSVWLENEPTNNECLSDGRWVIDFSNDPIAKEKYSAILAAATSRTPVVLQYTSTQGCGSFGAKKIHYVDVSY